MSEDPEFFSHTREEFLNEFVHPDDRPAVEEAHQGRVLAVPGPRHRTASQLVRNHNSPTPERAIEDARYALGGVLESDGSPGNDAYVAVITNRDTGHRWILRRGSATVEFRTPGMLHEQVAAEQLSLEEAKALADEETRVPRLNRMKDSSR